MSQVDLTQYPSQVITTEQITNSDTCSVCLERYIEGFTTVQILPCGHFFHPICLQGWAEISATCPFCRYQLPSALSAMHFELIRPIESSIFRERPPTVNIRRRNRTPSRRRRRSQIQARSQNRGRSQSRGRPRDNSQRRI